MARIIKFGDWGPDDLKENPLKSLWGGFKSLDKFTKFLILTIIAVIALFPVLSDPKRLINIFVKGEECKTTVTGFDAASVNLARDAAGAGGVVCFPAGTYKGDLAASVQGQVWKFDPGIIVEGRLSITGSGATIRGEGATLRRPATTNEWADGYDVTIGADDVTLENLKIRGGGFGIGVFGSDRVKIREVDVAETFSAALGVWSSNRGSDDLLVENSRFVVNSTPNHRASAVIGRNDNPDGQPPNARPVFRNLYMDQGPEGWFGMELFESPGMIIEGGEYRGGEVLISPGRSHGLKVLNAKLYLGGRTHSAVEVAQINDTEIAGNTVEGPGGLAWLTNKSDRLNIHDNKLSAQSYLVNAELRTGYEGRDHKATNNCVSDPSKVWLGIKGAGTIIEKNGPADCQVTSQPSPTPTPSAVGGNSPTPSPTAMPTLAPTPTAAPLAQAPAPGLLPQGYIFDKAINFGGNTLTVDGKTFAAEGSSGVTHNGKIYYPPSATLSPATDTQTSDMIRSGIWTDTGRWEANVTLPNGNYQIYVYSWEDNSPMAYSLEVEGGKVLTNVSTGNANTWRKIGPFPANVADGKLTIVSTGGHFLLSGLEIYKPTPPPISVSTPTPVPTPTPTPTPTPVVIPSNSFAANYYWNTTLSGNPYHKTTEAYPLNKSWGTAGPGGGLPGDNWSAKYEGSFSFENSDYEFTVSSDDGARVYLDGKLIINSWKPQALTTLRTTTSLTSGKHDVKVEYSELGGLATLSLNWKKVVPTSSNLCGDKICSGTCALGVCIGSETTPAKTTHLTSTNTVNMSQFCTSGAQLCNSTFITNVTTSQVLKAEFNVPQAFCSSVRLHLYVDGVKKQTTPFLGWNGATGSFAQLPKTTGAVDLGPVNPGSHILGVQAEGQRAGCNSGKLATWGGPLIIHTSSEVVPGNGLAGLYYSSNNLTGIPALRIDPTIDFNWVLGSPMNGIPVGNFSIRWTGFIVVPRTERYTFYTTSDDGARLWVNNVQLVNNWKGQAANEASGSIQLTAGQRYPITIEYMELGSVASMNLKWSSSSTPKTIIPTSALYSK